MTEPFGYIYLITNMLDGRIYVGKKQLKFTRKKKLSKRARKKSGNMRKRVEYVQVDSGWDNYMGSSKELTEDIKKLGKHNFKKEILRAVFNKADASYWELYWQIELQVMFVPSYNKWLSAKIFKNRLINQKP